MDLDRKTAYEVLMDIEKNQAYSNLALNQYMEKNKPKNQGFIRELVYGVLKNKILLDYYLDSLVVKGVKKLKKQDLTLLRMGIYQIKYMNSVPAYAAVNETVNMAKVFARGRQGFINGVLRGFLKKQEGIALPSKEEEPISYYSVQYSIAPWIVKLWIDAYGEKTAERLMASSNETPQLSLRTNILKISRDDLAEKLEKASYLVKKGSETDRVLFAEGSNLLETELYREGYFAVQDQASVMAADAVGAEKNSTVIDVCAAPGGKTFAMAERMENSGSIIAMDLYEHKLELIKKQAAGRGIDIIQTRCQDSTQPVCEFTETADFVLADVPCSGLGVLKRKPEIKYKGCEELPELIERQRKILQAAAGYVKPGGILVYSTCTINPDENEKQTEHFLAGHPEFQEIFHRQLLPCDETDGFFICRMKKVKVNDIK